MTGRAAGTARGRAGPGSARLPAGSVPYYSRHFRGRRGAQRPAWKSGQTARNRCQPRGAHSHPAGQGAGRGGTQNPTQPHANDTGAYILLLAVTSRLVLEAGPAAFLLQWTRGLAGSAVLLAALAAQEVTRFGRNRERAGGVDLPAEPLVQRSHEVNPRETREKEGKRAASFFLPLLSSFWLQHATRG